MKTRTVPVSLRLDADLLRRADAYARKRRVGVTTALRMMISERLDSYEADAELDAAMRWQRERAWKEFERWRRGEGKEYTLEDVRRVHARALGRRKR